MPLPGTMRASTCSRLSVNRRRGLPGRALRDGLVATMATRPNALWE
jgi:hypothetical protein